MHEYGIAEVIVHAIEQSLEKTGAKPKKCYVTMGALCGINPEALEGVFEIAAKNSLAEGSELKASISPTKFRCRNCDREFKVDEYIDMLICEDCGSPDVEFPDDAKHIYMTKLVIEKGARKRTLDLKNVKVEERHAHEHSPHDHHD